MGYCQILLNCVLMGGRVTLIGKQAFNTLFCVWPDAPLHWGLTGDGFCIEKHISIFIVQFALCLSHPDTRLFHMMIGKSFKGAEPLNQLLIIEMVMNITS